MIVIKVPKEIRNYKETVVLGLTLRQFVCLLLALIVGVRTYMLVCPIFKQDISQYICVLPSIPILVYGFFSFQEKPIEYYIKIWLKFHFGYKRIRKINTLNFWEELEIEADKEMSKSSKKMKRKVN